MPPLGLISWILMGLAAGLLASRFLPGPRLGAATAMAVGLLGALVGGVIATAFGFGGLVGFDPRGLFVATLGAVLALLSLRAVQLPDA